MRLKAHAHSVESFRTRCLCLWASLLTGEITYLRQPRVLFKTKTNCFKKQFVKYKTKPCIYSYFHFLKVHKVLIFAQLFMFIMTNISPHIISVYILICVCFYHLVGMLKLSCNSPWSKHLCKEILYFI